MTARLFGMIVLTCAVVACARPPTEVELVIKAAPGLLVGPGTLVESLRVLAQPASAATTGAFFYRKEISLCTEAGSINCRPSAHAVPDYTGGLTLPVRLLFVPGPHGLGEDVRIWVDGLDTAGKPRLSSGIVMRFSEGHRLWLELTLYPTCVDQLACEPDDKVCRFDGSCVVVTPTSSDPDTPSPGGTPGTIDTTYGQGGRSPVLSVGSLSGSVSIATSPPAWRSSRAAGSIRPLRTRVFSRDSIATAKSTRASGKWFAVFPTSLTPPNGNCSAVRVATTDGGKILVIATFSSPSFGTTRAVVMQFSSNGEVDTLFGNLGTGVMFAPFPGLQAFATSAQVLADGRIVVVGGYTSGIAHIAVTRLLPNGDVDVGFGGAHFPDFTGGSEVAYDVLLDVPGAGSFVLAGSSTNAAMTTGLLARYLEDGALDQSFGSGGHTSGPMGGEFHHLTRAPEGKVFVSGMVGADDVIYRYGPAGMSDLALLFNGVVSGGTTRNNVALVPTLNGGLAFFDEAFFVEIDSSYTNTGEMPPVEPDSGTRFSTAVVQDDGTFLVATTTVADQSIRVSRYWP